MKRICIVTTRHICYNPRVLKEADALQEKGYEVSVVTVNNHSQQRKFDEDLMKERQWKLKTVNFRKNEEKFHWLYLSLKQNFFFIFSKISFKNGIAERAVEKAFSPLLRLAIRQKADFYLAHHAEAMAIAFKASKKRNVKFGFDAEDFHTGMNESAHHSHYDLIIAYLENKYLNRCHYISAASKGISEAYQKKYNLKNAEVILNVFPIVNLKAKEPNVPVKFYWYSQVIGPNRNLEFLVKAASKINGAFEVHLRGTFQSQQYKDCLNALISGYNLNDNFFFHEPIIANEIISDASQFDVGLALESDVSVNRNICVTNKIFSYLMSGLAIVGTDTYGQKDIFSNFSNAVYVCKMNDEEDLANGMCYYIHNLAQLYLAKKTAREAAETTFNWEQESKFFLGKIEILFTDN